MKKLLMALLSDKSGVSMLRLMSIVSLLNGCVIGLYGVYKGADLGGIAELCTVFVAGAFGGKVGQKMVEVKNNEQDKEK